jgi:hypothetical protein
MTGTDPSRSALLFPSGAMRRKRYKMRGLGITHKLCAFTYERPVFSGGTWLNFDLVWPSVAIPEDWFPSNETLYGTYYLTHFKPLQTH